MVELDVPAMVHVSAVTNPNFHATGSHYLNADTTAFMQLLQADLFDRLPRACGWSSRTAAARCPTTGAGSAGWPTCSTGRRRSESVLGNVFFDTCVYHQPGIDLLFDVIDVDNILFGSEMVGAVRGIDPRTGHHFDDTRRYVEALPLTPDEQAKVFEHNARKVYQRLSAALPAQT